MKQLFFFLALFTFVLFSCTKRQDPFGNGNTGGTTNVPVATNPIDLADVSMALNMELNAKKRKLEETEFTPKNRVRFESMVTNAVLTRTASSAEMEVDEVDRLARDIEAIALSEAANRCPAGEDRVLAYHVAAVPSIGTGRIGEPVTISIDVSYLLGCKSVAASSTPPPCSLNFPINWKVQGTANGEFVPPGLADCLESDIAATNNNLHCQYSSGIPNNHIQFEDPPIIEPNPFGPGLITTWSNALYHKTVYWDNQQNWWPETPFTQSDFDLVLSNALVQANQLANLNLCTNNPNDLIYVDFQLRNAWYLPQGNGGIGSWIQNNNPPLGGTGFSQSDFVLHRYITAHYYFKDCAPPQTPCL